MPGSDRSEVGAQSLITPFQPGGMPCLKQGQCEGAQRARSGVDAAAASGDDAESLVCAPGWPLNERRARASDLWVLRVE